VVRGIWRFNAEARVNDEVAASATLMCAGKEIES
jgi:3-hydroxyacyl-[acyl-carrier-protein] dehydratase